MSQTAVDHYLNEFSRRSAAPAEWLNNLRTSAIELLRDQGFPTGRHEDWKYTNVRPITSRKFTTLDAGKGLLPDGLLERFSLVSQGCHELVFINGEFSNEHSRIPEQQQLVVTTLQHALQHDHTGLREYFDKTVGSEKNAFDVLNSALLADGIYVELPEGLQLENPLHLLYLGTQQEQSRLSCIRNLFILGRNASAMVIETYAGPDSAEYFTNTVTELVLAGGANLDHYKLQQESLQAFHIGDLRVRQSRDSHLQSHSINLGGSLVRNNIVVELGEPGAEVLMNGLYMAAGKQHVDNHTTVHHLVPNTRSQEYYRGVLNDTARGVFNGRVVVHAQAQKTDAHQSNANLLLSDKAEVDTKPELEIYADDVKCSHGATVGQLDENMLFYLRSRAIDADTGRSLLTFAFAEEVVNRLRFKPLRDRLQEFVAGKLPDTDLIREFIK